MTGIPKSLLQHKAVLLYGTSLALLLFLLRWLELRYIVFDYALEVYIGFIAFIFTSLGIWLALKLTNPQVKKIFIDRKILVHNAEPFSINEHEVNRLGLSKREVEVLQLMAEGYSNGEIAGNMFISLNTVKTHASKLFEKLDVKRRTQAIEKAKRLQLIP